jgi:hypothetical protein
MGGRWGWMGTCPLPWGAEDGRLDMETAKRGSDGGTTRTGRGSELVSAHSSRLSLRT